MSTPFEVVCIISLISVHRFVSLVVSFAIFAFVVASDIIWLFSLVMLMTTTIMMEVG